MKSRQKIKNSDLKNELLGEQSPELLKELHLLTVDGNLNADARRKLKQVNHLVNLIRPAIEDLSSRHPLINVVDVGAGKGYLGFILYELFFKNKETGKVISVESRKELIDDAQKRAARLKFKNMDFILAAMESAPLPERVHLLTALHACDTATDDAIISGVKSKADYIALVPCCQAEVARQLQSLKVDCGEIPQLWAHGIHRREFGSHITNVVRILLLEAYGYQVSVTELVGFEHSMKNEFIFAKKINRDNPKAKEKLQKLLTQIPIIPKCVKELF